MLNLLIIWCNVIINELDNMIALVKNISDQASNSVTSILRIHSFFYHDTQRNVNEAVALACTTFSISYFINFLFIILNIAIYCNCFMTRCCRLSILFLLVHWKLKFHV